ncbi:hypothetical protein K443DRAFT_503054 [Laccaria amethystina LaAM-08-1]|uniref:Uncharacterized protein n=1 Tax=Laccaria amethystina LaAM-08-1 TaxID=1095629 RepID=A0A0C9XDS6_9AGAR|nr:hypothetical protein K443DRAFT_503054 [Laccaria amethystina LaAM-08-1]
MFMHTGRNCDERQKPGKKYRWPTKEPESTSPVEGSRANSVQFGIYSMTENLQASNNVTEGYLTSQVCSSMSRLRSVLLNLSRRAGDFPRVVGRRLCVPGSMLLPPTHTFSQKK